MSTADMEAMATEMEGKQDLDRPVRRFSEYCEEEEPEEKSQSNCHCHCPLWCLVTLILFALILGIAGVAAYNLYANITNGQKLTVVEQAANRDTIVQLFNVTSNNTIEIALEHFVETVNDDLQRIQTDIGLLRNTSDRNIDQLSRDIQTFRNNVNGRLSLIENTTLNRMELDRVESDLSNLSGRVDSVEDQLSSSNPLVSPHPVLLTVVGLLVLLSARFF